MDRLARSPLPHGEKIFLGVIIYALFMVVGYIITSYGFSSRTPKPHYVLEKEQICLKLWWPAFELNHTSWIDLTGYYPGDDCFRDSKYQDKKNIVQKEINQIRDALKSNKINETGAHGYHTKLLQLPPVEIGKFQPIDFTGGYVLSAFHNRRDEIIPDGLRVLYMVPLNTPDMYCHTLCNGVYVTVKGRPETLQYFPAAAEHCIWTQYALHCRFGPECRNITHVSITSYPCIKPTNILPILRSDAEFKSPSLFGACINHMYNLTTKDVPRIVNYFETGLYFGMDIFYLYGYYGIDTDVLNVLKYYVKKGVLKIYNYTIPEDVSSLFNFAQVIQFMDCSFRHVEEAEYLLLTDLDELFYPIYHRSYRDLVREPEVFTNFTSGLTLPRTISNPPVGPQLPYTSKTNTVGDKSHEKADGIDYMLCDYPYGKLLVKPQRVLTVSVHYIALAMKPFHNDQILPRHVAALHHVKNINYTCQPHLHLPYFETIPMNYSLNRDYPHIRQIVENVYTQVLQT